MGVWVKFVCRTLICVLALSTIVQGLLKGKGCVAHLRNAASCTRKLGEEADVLASVTVVRVVVVVVVVVSVVVAVVLVAPAVVVAAPLLLLLLLSGDDTKYAR